jgi:cobaltochelatase CobS
MEQNELINQVTNTIKTEILKNKDLLKSIVSEIKLSAENIDPNLILSLMSQMNANLQINQPKSNAPKVTAKDKSKIAEKPLVIGSGSLESQIISDLLEGNNVYLMGKAGTGKTYLAKAIPPAMGQPMYVINCSQWTSPIEIRGGQTIEGYVEGQLIEAWAKGGILILDELPKLDPNTAGLLNDALAEAASQPKYDENGKVIASTIPKITNGRGDVILKGQDQPDENLKFRFCVIGTGNTNMMDVGNKYGGNQRQDYSLVDRFAGSIYTLDVNELNEKRLIYPYVFNVCSAMRKFLNDEDALQSISLRTMLNFNRTFEQEMLYKIGSPFADEILDNSGNRVPPKPVSESIKSFKDMLEPNLRAKLESYSAFKRAEDSTINEMQFIIEFKQRYHIDPLTQKPLTDKEVVELDAEARKINSPLSFLG